MGCEMARIKKELVADIAAKYGFPVIATTAVVQTFLDLLLEEILTAGRMELRDFGVWEVREREVRKARNPRTGEPVLVPSRKVITFQPGRNVLARLNGEAGAVADADADGES